MSGKRALDLISLAKVSRSVIGKYVTLQRQQFQVYGKASSLLKALEAEPARATETTRATSALTRKGIVQQQTRQASPSVSRQKTLSSKAGATGVLTSEKLQQQGIDQDQFSSKFENHPTEPSGSHDSTILPSESPINDTDSNSDVFSDEQSFLSLKQPLAAAKTESQLKPEPSDRGNITKPVGTPHALHASSSGDSSSTSNGSAHWTQALATPQNEHSGQGDAQQPQSEHSGAATKSHSSNGHYNVPSFQGVPQQEQPSEDVISELFHSPKVSKILRQSPTRPSSLHQTRPQRSENAVSDMWKPLNELDRYHNNRAGGLSSDPPDLEETQSSRSLGDNVAARTMSEHSPTPTSTTPYPAENTTELVPQSHHMHESKVPSSRLGRMWHYGGLASSMAFGAVGESLRRATGSGSVNRGSLMLSNGNMERLVSKLSKMRGAALKLGQMISFQDSKMLPEPIQQVLQRVQDNADYMPAVQRDKVLIANLGPDWRDLFLSFEETPMAAASIGQVHGAVLRSNGMPVAVKIQYPGVATSIDSDLNNISILLTASRILPKGLFLDKTIANARVELAWECDYIREATAARRFASLLEDEKSTFSVPSIVDEASSRQVLTMERMNGVAVTQIKNLSQEQKDWIGSQILRLCLREICEFRYMQTDPNWTNFLYNQNTQKLELLDFGASRDYPIEFIEPYLRVLQAAARDDKAALRDVSIQLGYLTGHESKTMLDAHIASILTLAEPFADSAPKVYDFNDQTITERVRSLIPVMIRERLAPPPEETYSLHRKLSGAFLLCARLGSKVGAREMFARAMEKAPT